MWDSTDLDRHVLGEFCLNGENLQGEITRIIKQRVEST